MRQHLILRHAVAKQIRSFHVLSLGNGKFSVEPVWIDPSPLPPGLVERMLIAGEIERVLTVALERGRKR